MTITESMSIMTETKILWKEFFKAVERFTILNSRSSQLEDIYLEGLAVYSKLPYCKANAIFIYNEEAQTYELKNTLPEQSESYMNNLYEYLLDESHIGLAINSGKIINVDHNLMPESDYNVMIIPLFKRQGIIGLVLSVHNNNYSNDIDQFILQLCGVFSSLLGNAIENIFILNQLEINKSTLEQKIATRTLDLAQSRRELKAIFDSVLTGVMVYDMKISKIVRVNPVACNIIGLDDSEIVGRSVFDFLQLVDYEQINENPENKCSNSYNSVLISGNGSEVNILRNTTKLRINNRVLITESFLDITKIKEAEIALTKTNEILELKVQERTEDLQLIVHQLKQEISDREFAENELRIMLEQQKELSDLKTLFVSMVSHEFRTPLTIIKSSAQMVSKFKQKLSDNEKENYLERIQKSVDNLTELIENVVFMGKNDNNKIDYNFKDFDMHKLINDVIKNFKNDGNDDRNFIIEYHTNQRNIYTDKKLLQMVLNNLISNAIKYSSIDKNIIIVVSMQEKNLSISVQDFGIGIPENEQKNIFELFYRAENATEFAGSGIGLAVVHESMLKLGGEIEMSSKLGYGSEFKIFLPI
jgi:PAS domain S-box-containing protein